MWLLKKKEVYENRVGERFFFGKKKFGEWGQLGEWGLPFFSGEERNGAKKKKREKKTSFWKGSKMREKLVEVGAERRKQ